MSRSKSFSHEEDIIICEAYLDISQDPIAGKNQTKDKLWERVSVLYHKRRNKSDDDPIRTPKSLKCRYHTISTAINKFRGCIRQVESRHQSGASELDIINNAKILFAQDPKEKRGFLYYHVWPILKDTEKFGDIPNSHQFEFSEGSQTGTQAFASPNTPSSVDLSVDDNEQTPVETPSESSCRPIGRKKEKMRKRLASDNSQVLASMLEDNRAILETLKRGEMKRDERFVQMDKDSAMRYQLMMIQAENNYHKLDLQRERQEKEFMEKDLNSINDPIEREYF
ncbi:hypothetical protein BVC80_1801g29 [Macleaya cordata]|uniref:No apical meristem-associated C-terminal domain-containing protein n=1 Tax=Macleaya cordata TaxID=56857 RepID=A0A200PMM2_MACCD|nr:hypothetical protein BVC80_1801g29 [Macleaya cordata]